MTGQIIPQHIKETSHEASMTAHIPKVRQPSIKCLPL